MANVKQAPNMMQASALAGQEPDLYAQQLDLQRRQQFADMLRKQASTAIDPNRTAQGGVAIKISPWEGAAKMAQAYLAHRADKTNDEDQVKIGSAMAQRQAAALKALAPAGTFDGAAPITLSDQPQASTPENYRQPVDSNIKQAWIRALKVSEINPELGSKIIQNLSEVTPNQKDWAAQGLDPRTVGAAEMGKLKAGGLVNVAPNNTVLDASTQKPIFAAPDFNSGRQNTFGQNGAPQISPMQGSELIPQQAGQVKRAEAAGSAGFDMVTVIGDDGKPVMMTREQAAQRAASMPPQGQPQPQMPQQSMPQAAQGAQPPNQGFSVGTQIPAMTGAATSDNRLATLQQERQQMVARNASSADLQMIDREIANVSRAGAPAMSTQPNNIGLPGIPLQSDAQREAQVGAARTANAVDEALAKALPQERKDKQNALVKANSAIALIDKALVHPGLPEATGLQGLIDPRNYMPGTNAKNFHVLSDQLKGKTFLEAMDSLRGTGQITEVEGKKATDAIARLNLAQSTPEYMSALSDLKASIQGSVGRSQATKDSIDVARDKLRTPTMDDILAEMERRKGKK